MTVKLDKSATPIVAIVKGLQELSGEKFTTVDFSILNSVGDYDKPTTDLEMQIVKFNPKYFGEVTRKYQRVHILDSIEQLTGRRDFHIFTNKGAAAVPTESDVYSSLVVNYGINVDLKNLTVLKRDNKYFCRCNCRAYYGEFEVIPRGVRVKLSSYVGTTFTHPWVPGFDFKWDENYDGETRFRKEIKQYHYDKGITDWDLEGVLLEPTYESAQCYMNFEVPAGHIYYEQEKFKSKYNLYQFNHLAPAIDPNFNAAEGALLVYPKNAADITSEDYIPILRALGEQWGFPIDLKSPVDVKITAPDANRIQIWIKPMEYTFNSAGTLNIKLVPEPKKIVEIFPDDNLDMFENPLEETRK